MAKRKKLTSPSQPWRNIYLLMAIATGTSAFLLILPAVALVPATLPTGSTLFSFSDYVASLALMLVVLTLSDFRYRYRVSLLAHDLRGVAFWTGLAIGFAILIADFWFQKGLPVPHFLNDLLNIKLVLATLFLSFIFYLNLVAFIRPPTFTRRNARSYAHALYKAIGEGNRDRLAIVAEELERSVPKLLELAATVPRIRKDEKPPELSIEQEIAHDVLLLLGETRFCDVVATQTPWVAAEIFWELRENPGAARSLSAFSTNVSTSLIMSRASTLHQEDSGFYSGLIGDLRPISTALYGSWEVVEACSAAGMGPLDLSYHHDSEMDRHSANAFARVALMFADDYFSKTGGRRHSYAYHRVVSKFEGLGRGVYGLDGKEDFGSSKEFAQLSAAVEFAVGLVDLLGKHNVREHHVGKPRVASGCPYDRIALLYFELLFESAVVSKPHWSTWAIQHNLVWSGLFGRKDFAAMPRVRRKVVRLLWDEIKEMDKWANFKGARVLGLCLNILGLNAPDRRTEYRREFYALHLLILRWTEKNYYRLHTNHPKVAETVLLGSISYDEENHRLVKTYSSDLGKKPNRRFLSVQVPPDGKVEPDPYEDMDR